MNEGEIRQVADRIIELLTEITTAHSDRDSPDWNDCGDVDKDCAWCEDAKKILRKLEKWQNK